MARVLFTDREGPLPAIEDVPATEDGPAVADGYPAGSPSTGLGSAGAFAAFNLSDTVGDDPAAVGRNRDRSAAALGARVAWMHQVHGADVVTLDAVPDQPLESVDAMVTTVPGVGLGVLVADCVPVVLVAPGVIGVAHSGRRGLQQGVLAATLRAMRNLGAATADVVVRLGPAICGRCYEVPADMQAEVEAAAPGSACVTAAGTTGLDLRAGLTAQAREAGVHDVRADARCTFGTPSLYSYRRDRTTGRSAGLVVL